MVKKDKGDIMDVIMTLSSQNRTRKRTEKTIDLNKGKRHARDIKEEEKYDKKRREKGKKEKP